MRYIFIIQVILLIILSSCQSKTSIELLELSAKVDSLTIKVDELSERNKMLEEEYTWVESEMVELSKLKHQKTPTSATPAATPLAAPSAKKAEKAVPDWQCIAITNSGSRCSRSAVKDSKYCWQHKKTYEPDKPEKKAVPDGTVSTDK